jgi:hypothetical protein
MKIITCLCVLLLKQITAMNGMSRVSSGSIVSEYGLEDRAIGVRSSAGPKDFSSVSRPALATT